MKCLQSFLPYFGALCVFFGLLLLFVVSPELLRAKNIFYYSDLITSSAPLKFSNHTFTFTTDVSIPARSTFSFQLPPDFELASSSVFSELRNVEMSINGVVRSVGPVVTLADDVVTIIPGNPAIIEYTLNDTAGIPLGTEVTVKIGNHTARTQSGFTEYSTTTGTTTIAADEHPIKNAAVSGSYDLPMTIRDQDGNEIANANFMVILVDQVGVGPVDNRETIPPERFNGAPTGTLPGTTFAVEITFEVNEFSICRYSMASGTPYSAMTDEFGNISRIFQSIIFQVQPNTEYKLYVRCMDDEGNVNIDDFLIAFKVDPRPTGQSTTEGTTSGDGSGTGTAGSGSASTTGTVNSSSTNPQTSTGGGQGASSGAGGSGGGAGGGSGGGSGGGGGGGQESVAAPFRSGDGQVVIGGFASPRAKITALVDGKSSATAVAGSDGAYTVTIDKIAKGVYTFGVYATDAANIKSSTFSTSFTVSGARTSELSNINLAPSLLATPNPVNPGQTLTLSGYTIPNAKVIIENEKDKSPATRQSFTATANSSGQWSVLVDTSSFSQATYKARVRAEGAAGIVANFSQYTQYGVGQGAKPVTGINSDLNRDGKVNLTDFSILLFWWNSAGGDSNPPADISQDGKVNLTDFSILLFNWTG